MKRVICDQCKKETEPDTYGLAPRGGGWVTVSLRDEGHKPSLDFCSKACAVAALRDPEPVAPIASPDLAHVQ